jgi:hypothetical protein
LPTLSFLSKASQCWPLIAQTAGPLRAATSQMFYRFSLIAAMDAAGSVAFLAGTAATFCPPLRKQLPVWRTLQLLPLFFLPVAAVASLLAYFAVQMMPFTMMTMMTTMTIVKKEEALV